MEDDVELDVLAHLLTLTCKHAGQQIFLYKGTKCCKGTKGLTTIIVKVTLHLKFDELSNRSFDVY